MPQQVTRLGIAFAVVAGLRWFAPKVPSALVLLVGGLATLLYVGASWWMAFTALALFFAGFNFLEAGLPARLSLVADDDSRGASLGLFASSQFFGAFVGGLIGGRFLATGRPADVFFVCVLLGVIWLSLHGFGRRPGADAR